MTRSETEEQASIVLNRRDYARMEPPGERIQSMAGFEDTYTDIVDYIIRCTHRIWEEKGIGLIYTHYNHHAIIHMTDGLTYGRDPVIEMTVRTLAAYPDVRLYGDEVIWSGNDVDGYHSSHRITWVGHNTGYSIYGPPTGRKVVRRGTAHCLVRDNRIVEEWICRDELALVRQLGFDEVELARRHGAADLERAAASPLPLEIGEVARLQGQLPPRALPPLSQDGFDVEDFAHHAWHEVWNWRLLNRLPAYWSENVVAFVSTNRRLDGLGEYAQFVLAMLAAFPDGAMSVDHVCAIGSEAAGDLKVAVRWTFQGTHKGYGHLGAPSGRRVKLMGISHLELDRGRIAREFTIFDEFALLKQIHAPEPLVRG